MSSIAVQSLAPNVRAAAHHVEPKAAGPVRSHAQPVQQRRQLQRRAALLPAVASRYSSSVDSVISREDASFEAHAPTDDHEWTRALRAT